MRVYLISGEASGDLHGGHLIKQWKKINTKLECRAWGGDHLRAAGAEVVKDFKETAFMGFAEVVRHLGTIKKLFQFCKADILDFKPDILMLVDYPGFNLRIATWAKKNGIKVFYFISPQIWAWKEGRIRKIKASVDEMFVILPFEKAFYRKHQMNVHYLGHPLLELVDSFHLTDKYTFDKPVIALLPGSRNQEIKKNLSIMLSIYDKLSPKFKFVIACAPGIKEEIYLEEIRQYGDVALEKRGSYSLLKQSDLALVSSGTATLETALFGVPQIVCYKTSGISYFIAKALIKVKFISLVNLILNRPHIPELIQRDFNAGSILANVNKLLAAEQVSTIKDGYLELRTALGQHGAYERLARKMQELVD